MYEPLDELAKLTDAIYQAELTKMKTLIKREAELRQKLLRLDEQRRKNMAIPNTQMVGARQIGADVLWQGWVGRTRHELNIQLAQVMAQKAKMVDALRHTFGRQIAASELLETAQNDRYQRSEKQHQLYQDNLQILKLSKG